MLEMASPTKDLVRRILSEVGFEDRLTAYRLREKTGVTSITLYSFEEVVGLLNDPHPRMDFQVLETWVSKVMGDAELAEKIRRIIYEDMSDRDRALRIRDLMALRLYQCMKSAGENEGIAPIKG